MGWTYQVFTQDSDGNGDEELSLGYDTIEPCEDFVSRLAAPTDIVVIGYYTDD